MLIKCPCCGSRNSLDSLIDNDAAANALNALANLTGISKAVIKYIALFRPEKNMLTFDRVATLINELTPLIQQQRIERNGQVYDAPPAVWESAIEQMLIARSNGKLKTPLKSHGYLFEIIAGESAKAALHGVQIVAVDTGHKPQPTSKMARTLAALDED